MILDTNAVSDFADAYFDYVFGLERISW